MTSTDTRYIRQTALFDPTVDRAVLGIVAQVGCGATGSAVLTAITKMGILDPWVFDPDRLEPHNTPNQLLYAQDYALESTPRANRTFKLDAAHDALNAIHGGTDVHWSKTRFIPAAVRYTDTLIMCLDTLEGRRRIWAQCQRYPRLLRLIDVSIGGMVSVVRTLTRAPGNPWHPGAVEQYERHLEAADQDGCGAQSFIGSAMIVAGRVAQTLAALSKGGEVPFEWSAYNDASTHPLLVVGPVFPTTPPETRIQCLEPVADYLPSPL